MGTLIFAGSNNKSQGEFFTDSSVALDQIALTDANPNGPYFPGELGGGIGPDDQGGGGAGIVGPVLFSFDGSFYLQGQDNDGQVGLFAYTPASSGSGGTSAELGIQSQGSYGINPMDFVVYDNQVYFDGQDNTGLLAVHDLWVINGRGTQATVEELTNSPQDPSSMAVYDGLLFMAAADSNNTSVDDLYAFNGATFTTIGASGLNPTGMTVATVGIDNGQGLPTDMFFNGLDAQGNHGLFVYTGSGSPSEIYAGVNGVASGLDPDDMVALQAGQYADVYFSGVDKLSNNIEDRGLWYSQGTTATEIVTSSQFGASDLDPYDLTALNGALYFTGYDSGGGRGLFAYEYGQVTELVKSSQYDLSDGFVPAWGENNANTLTSFNGTLYFGASKNGGAIELYDVALGGTGTNPTATVNLVSSAVTSPALLTSLATTIPVQDDFNGDGTSDLLLQNGSGNLADWIMQNGTLVGGNEINNPFLYGYSVVHDTYDQLALTGDFNGDGTTDLLLQNGSGNLADWIMQNGTLVGGNEINNPALYGYSVVGTGDFNGDGTTDILLQNSSGNLADWTMHNGTLMGGNEINNPALYGYSVVGTGDFNGDGTTDLLLQNGSGNLADWIMQNGTLVGGNEINNPALYGYSVVGTGDFNGDGTTDILLQNSSGNLADWIMQNGTLVGGNEIGNPSSYGYHFVGTGDFNGDGTTDILLQNSSGNLADWILQNGTLAGGNNINNPTAYGYHLA